MDNNSKRNNKILMVIIAILVVIIIILLFKGCSKKEDNISHNEKINVFEIKCDVDCDCEQKDDNDKKNENNQDNKSNDDAQEVIKTIDDDVTLDINVSDNNKTWKDKEIINLFGDSSYVVKGKIAPESTGTYQFEIKNSSKYNVKYDIDFTENNSYNINMKYKLKKNNNYVISDWVSYLELKQANIKINKNVSDTYYLEWKWVSSSNDNSIGEDINSKYGLSINIKAVQAND